MRKNFWFLVIIVMTAIAGGAAIMYGLQSIPSFASSVCSVRAKTNIEQALPLTDTFRAQGISFMYPENMKSVSPADGASAGLVGYLETDEQATIIDPLSRQSVTEPRIRLEITKESNTDAISLQDFVDAKSESKEEVVRTLDDQDGNKGIRQWVWFKGNPIQDSYQTYYIGTGDSIWQLRAKIFDQNPDTQSFLQASQLVGAIFDSVKFE